MAWGHVQVVLFIGLHQSAGWKFNRLRLMITPPPPTAQSSVRVFLFLWKTSRPPRVYFPRDRERARFIKDSFRGQNSFIEMIWLRKVSAEDSWWRRSPGFLPVDVTINTARVAAAARTWTEGHRSPNRGLKVHCLARKVDAPRLFSIGAPGRRAGS